MVLCEDGDCGVCLQRFSRQERIPRVLHCRHTFCAACLETMSQVKSGMVTVVCPMCRQMTCVGRGRTLSEALWVDSRLWEQIPEKPEGEEEGEAEGAGGKEEKAEASGQTQRSSQAECPSSKHSRTKLKFPGFLRSFSLNKPQERIVPGGSVEMKSWRRLSTEDTF
ncbi:E3 ubiquitin-protein ligase RNF186 [Osmerus mordax]|uniref:E3 ubiquitin-protein ligase RNF186 n=1 Tax=Osmerus mordax TaxID=8014 RepID=UPI0035106C43